MGEVVMPQGQLGSRYARKGGHASGQLARFNSTLVRVSGEVVTFDVIQARYPTIAAKALRWQIAKYRRRGEPVTWDKLDQTQQR